MDRILIFECSSKTLDRNVGYVFDPLLFSNGKATKEFIKEHVFV
jgi:hypothetical protein